jgi:hypothetical protein
MKVALVIAAGLGIVAVFAILLYLICKAAIYVDSIPTYEEIHHRDNQ